MRELVDSGQFIERSSPVAVASKVSASAVAWEEPCLFHGVEELALRGGVGCWVFKKKKKELVFALAMALGCFVYLCMYVY